MGRIKPPLRDTQDEPFSGYCRICGAELYGYDAWPLCDKCWEELNEWEEQHKFDE